MSEKSHNSQPHVQQVIFNLAAFFIVVAGLKLASEILIPFLLAIFIAEFNDFIKFSICKFKSK